MNMYLDAIKDHQSISQLTVSHNFKNVILADSVVVERLATEHPALIELQFAGFEFKANDAITLIRQLHLLKRIDLVMQKTDYSQFSSQLNDSEWEIFTFDLVNVIYYLELTRRMQQQ